MILGINRILPELLEWIQDINWPVAQEIAPLLSRAGPEIAPHISAILKSDDDVWKYWTIGHVIENLDREVGLLLRADLERIANSPTSGEKLEEVDIVAREALGTLAATSG